MEEEEKKGEERRREGGEATFQWSRAFDIKRANALSPLWVANYEQLLISRRPNIRRNKNTGTLVFPQDLDSSRFHEQIYVMSASVCPTGAVYGILHVEVDLDSISFNVFSVK